MIGDCMGEVKRPARRERAEQTRRKILAAAQAEFIEKGYAGATIASIAVRAGVAQQTVYFVFNTKPKLISAVIDAAVMGEAAEIPEETQWWKEMAEAPDPAAGLRSFIEGALPLFERASLIGEILRAAARTDDEVRATQEYHDGMQREGYSQVIGILAGKGSLKSGLTVQTATDLLLLFLGDAAFVVMTTEQGWSPRQWADWLSGELPAMLFDTGAD